MVTCANCDNQATYEVQNPGAEDQLFCTEHLPWFINLPHDLGGRVVPVIVTAEVIKPKGSHKTKRTIVEA